ncbi:hypothetical protein COO91_07317 [Nostoc flagelliforme CCNUN1]|uniref:Uncharacterized protein n=1 Tax=Nostoc flagelliforme CCNUN1 TaxID=2038116 RepID=A0A2K8T0S5_9NOSO|nr:hypothetical protein COO91_07317 [Nostoc flagelliforme CCNUN1]
MLSAFLDWGLGSCIPHQSVFLVVHPQRFCSQAAMALLIAYLKDRKLLLLEFT